MSDIFISYAHEDRPRVEHLAAALEQRGWSVWWDPAIRTGEDFGRRIHTTLQAARCVIVVWSHQSIASPWVKDEAQVGQERGVLLPVCIDAVAPPLGFRQLQTVDLTGWQPASPGSAFEKLVTDIAMILGERVGPQQEGDGEPTEATRASRARLRWRQVLLAGCAVVALAVGAYVSGPRTPVPPSGQPPVAQHGEPQSPEAARLTLSQLALPYTTDTFINSVKQGDVYAVKLFLAAGMDPNATDRVLQLGQARVVSLQPAGNSAGPIPSPLWVMKQPVMSSSIGVCGPR
jgi:hypothetical protein